MVIHTLDNALAQMCASDLMTLGNLIEKHTDGSGASIKIEEFHELALHLVRKNFVFNGPETADSLDLNQLDVLRSHEWKRKKPEKGVADSSEDAMGQFQSKFDVMDDTGKGHVDPRYSFIICKKLPYLTGWLWMWLCGASECFCAISL